MDTPWYLTSRFRRVAVVVAVLFFVGAGVDAIAFKNNDFEWHCGLGRAFLDGDPFRSHGEWYSLARAMMNAVPALLPYRLARAACYLLSLGCLAVSLVLWHRMAEYARPAGTATSFAAAALALAAILPYLTRDLQECGLQLILLAVLSAAAYTAWVGHDAQAGFWLGVAASYKTTPLLFLPVLVWKRRWRAAAWMATFTVGLNLLPAAYLGWDATIRSHRKAWEFVQRSAGVEDIGENAVEPPNTRNLALMAGFARYLRTYPTGHNLHLDHPAFVQPGNLDPVTARRVATIGLLLLGAFVAGRMWGRWGDRPTDLPTQWATACSFCALLSPLCWRQHLMLAIPTVFLLVRQTLARPPVSRLAWWLLGTSAFLVWLPQRDLMGRPLASVLRAMKPDLFLVLGASLLVLFVRQASPARTTAAPANLLAPAA